MTSNSCLDIGNDTDYDGDTGTVKGILITLYTVQ